MESPQLKYTLGQKTILDIVSNVREITKSLPVLKKKEYDVLYAETYATMSPPSYNQFKVHLGFIIDGQFYHWNINVGERGVPFSIEITNCGLDTGFHYESEQTVGKTRFTIEQILMIGKVLGDAFGIINRLFCIFIINRNISSSLLEFTGFCKCFFGHHL
jgi:hypothetical protein